jgi:hypothetical protein
MTMICGNAHPAQILNPVVASMGLYLLSFQTLCMLWITLRHNFETHASDTIVRAGIYHSQTCLVHSTQPRLGLDNCYIQVLCPGITDMDIFKCELVLVP